VRPSAGAGDAGRERRRRARSLLSLLALDAGAEYSGLWVQTQPGERRCRVRRQRCRISHAANPSTATYVVSAVAGVRRVDRRGAEAGSSASAGAGGRRAGDGDRSRARRGATRRCDAPVAARAASSVGELERPERRRRGASLDGDAPRGERGLLRLAAALPAVTGGGVSVLVRVRSRRGVDIDLARRGRARDRAGVRKPPPARSARSTSRGGVQRTGCGGARRLPPLRPWPVTRRRRGAVSGDSLPTFSRLRRPCVLGFAAAASSAPLPRVPSGARPSAAAALARCVSRRVLVLLRRRRRRQASMTCRPRRQGQNGVECARASRWRQGGMGWNRRAESRQNSPRGPLLNAAAAAQRLRRGARHSAAAAGRAQCPTESAPRIEKRIMVRHRTYRSAHPSPAG